MVPRKKVKAKRAPELGEHNDELLRGLGFSGDDINGFRASGTIPHAWNLETANNGGVK